MPFNSVYDNGGIIGVPMSYTDITKYSTTETKNNLLYCEHLREQYNKCILYDTLNCTEIYEPIMIGFKCQLTP